jgi:hypothetical protein
MTNSYAHYKNLYNNVKPIRGRSPEVRPIGNRRRDWEQVVRNDLGNGEYSYAAKFHNTQVVEYLPNGDVILRPQGWHTPSTAEFIHEHSPFTCWKQDKRLWVRVNNGSDVTAYPIGDELRMRLNADQRYEPTESIVIKKKVTDRVKAKEARKKVQPFLDWARVFLGMSDGWVMHETIKQTLGWSIGEGQWARYESKNNIVASMYDKISSPDADEETYLRVMCALPLSHATVIEKRLAETLTMPVGGHVRGRTFYDLRVDYEQIKAVVYRWVRQHEDVDKIVEVQPGAKAIYGTVTA